MTTRTMTVTARGKAINFESTLSDAAALAALATISGDFAASLAAQNATRGLSVKQLAWAHKLAADHQKPASAQSAVAVVFSTIASLMARLEGNRRAEGRRRAARIELRTASGGVLRLQVAGDRSKNPGAVNLTDGGPYGSSTWYGSISTDGALRPSRDMIDDVKALLGAFDSDPMGTLSAYGHSTCQCAICGRALDNDESRTRGIGPICADRLGIL